MSDAPQPVQPAGDPAQLVSGPAIGLMATAGIGIAVNALALVLNLMGAGIGAAAGADTQEGMSALMSGGLGMVSSVIGITVGVIVFIGAKKMKALESFGFALVSAILAAFPCTSPCCLIGLPIGIWAVIVLNKPEVKSAFH